MPIRGRSQPATNGLFWLPHASPAAVTLSRTASDSLGVSESQTSGSLLRARTASDSLGSTSTVPATVGNTSTKNDETLSGGTSWSHTVESAADLLVVSIGTSSGTPANVTSVTYAGSGLTFLSSAVSGLNSKTEVWYLKNPPVGTGTVAVSVDRTSTSIEGIGVSVRNAATGTVFGTPGTASNQNTASLSTSTTGGASTDLVLSFLTLRTGDSTATPGGTGASVVATTPKSSVSNTVSICSKQPGGTGTISESWTWATGSGSSSEVSVAVLGGTFTGVTDSAAGAVHVLSRVASDSAGASDGATTARQLTYLRTTADTAAATDIAAPTSARARTSGDSAAATDVATRAGAWNRTGGDTAAAADLAVRSAPRLRTGADSLSSGTPTSFVQGATNFSTPAINSLSAGTITVTAGNRLIFAVGVGGSDNNESVVVSDSRGNAWTKIADVYSATLSYRIQLWTTVAADSGALSASFAFIGGITRTFLRALLHEYAGVGRLDAVATSTGSGSTGPDSGAMTTSLTAAELVFGWAVSNNGTTSAGSGFTLRATSGSESTEDKTVTTTGSYDAVYPSDGSDWAAIGATFAGLGEVWDLATSAPRKARTASDALGGADSAPVEHTVLARIATDSAPAADVAVGTFVSGSVQLSRTASDAAAATDVANRTGARGRTASDLAGTADVALRSVVLARPAVSDVAAAADVVTRAVADGRTAGDLAHATDSPIRGGQALLRTANDTEGATDVATRAGTPARTSSDSEPASDLATRAAPRVRTASDIEPAADSDSRALALARSGSDAAPASDVATRPAATYTRTSANTAPAADVATRAQREPRTSDDAAPATDVASRAVRDTRTANDTAAAADATSTGGAPARTASDSAPAADQATSTAPAHRSTTDNAPAIDSPAQAVSTARTAHDNASAVDAAVRAAAVLTRLAIDLAYATDSAAATTRRAASAADNAPASDTATANLGLSRTAHDQTPTLDLASRAAQLYRVAVDIAAAVDVVNARPGHARDIELSVGDPYRTWAADAPPRLWAAQVGARMWAAILLARTSSSDTRPRKWAASAPQR